MSLVSKTQIYLFWYQELLAIPKLCPGKGVHVAKKPAIERSNNSIVIDSKDKDVSVQTLASFISMKSRTFF